LTNNNEASVRAATAFKEEFRLIQSTVDKKRHILSEKNNELSLAAAEKDLGYVTSTKKAIEEHCHQADEYSAVQRSKVYQQAGIVSEFWDTTYLIDSPTGATPRKKTYNYPKNISATSPHDRIISRFRATRRVYSDDEDRENF